MSTLAARRANLFRGRRSLTQQAPSDLPGYRATDMTGAGTIAEREKSELVERHLAAFEATLPPMTLSQGDRDAIRARAMLGPSNASAILASVMQAVAAVRPPLQPSVVNYYSSAAGVDAKQAEALLAAGARGGEAAHLRGIIGREFGRDRSSASDYGLAGLSRASASGFGLGSDGSISGMSTQFYQQNFQSLYGASPQGQFTASRVAGILGRNEGLSGEALVARTKEVARDTRDRLGLDTNIYAPKVANVGKKYSDPIIENKKNLDEARAAQQRGDTAAAALHERRFLDERKRQEERARREDPTKAGDVAGLYNGLMVEAMRNGWKPTDQNAAEVFRSVIQSPDPEAKKRLGEMLDAAKKTPEGAAMVDKLKPLIEQEQKAAAERREQEARAAAAATAAKTEVAAEADVFDAPAKPAQADVKKAEAPTQDTSPIKQAATDQPAVAKSDPEKQPPAPGKAADKAQVAAAPPKKPSGPAV